jgi:hypothetical protein
MSMPRSKATSTSVPATSNPSGTVKRRGRQPGWSPKTTAINYKQILSEDDKTKFLKSLIDLDPAAREKVVEIELPALESRVRDFVQAATGLVRTLKPQTMRAGA